MEITRRQIYAVILAYEGISEDAKLNLLDSISRVFDDVVAENVFDMCKPKEPRLEVTLAREFLKRYRKAPEPAPDSEPEADSDPAPAPATVGENY
jgi:hypothetical protein